MGVAAYVVAILQRSSLGVAGVAAVDRFEATAAALSMMTTLQLVVYAVLQIPVGVLIDRLGPRILIIAGLVFMAGGQALLAFAPHLSGAIVGRIFVGAGDAAVFVSVLRMVSSWFSGPIVPQLSQWIGNLGQLGQVLSALPFALILGTAGWTPAFLSASALCVLVLVFAIAFLSDRPKDSVEVPRTEKLSDAVRELGAAFKRPGTRLGFWSHFVTQSSATVFSLFWGFPFLVYGLGYSQQIAATLLLVIVGSGIVFGPMLGLLSARYPLRRSNIVLGLVAGLAIMWTTTLLWPGQPPLWVVLLLLVSMGAASPGSMIGFDFARTYNPVRGWGSANGIVNVGGFSASFVMMLGIGLILDFLGGHGSTEQTYTLANFRWAFLLQYVVIGIGVVCLLFARRHTRARMSEDDGVSVGPLWLALAARLRRSRD